MIFTSTSAAVLAASLTSLSGPPALEWQTIVNSDTLIPGTEVPYSSFNQPSIDLQGLAAFRARSTGPGMPVRGVWRRSILRPNAPIFELAVTGGEVPPPNNNELPPGSGEFASFTEFPAFPRIALNSGAVTTRGQHQPVWNYQLPDGSETSVGTAGVYAAIGDELVAGATLLGEVLDPDSGAPVFPHFQVPGMPAGTRFDQFPGAPSITDGDLVAFKGNYTDPDGDVGRTGVYFRHLIDNAGLASIRLIADTRTVVPGQGDGKAITFGSTASPSAALGKLVFLGLDNEDDPTMGGIYLTEIAEGAALEPLVEIGDPVPGEGDAQFTRIGEALSFDGRYVGFWGAWGDEFNLVLLECPEDGNPDLIEYCNEQYPEGFVASVPVNQGVFVYDTTTASLYRAARTGVDADDFIFWVFSGRVPQEGDEKGEEDFARWRSSAFVSVFGTEDDQFRVAFKTATGEQQSIDLWRGPSPYRPTTIVNTVSAGVLVDPAAPADSLVSTVGLEREGLRGDRLAIAVSMLDPKTKDTFAGLYVTDVSVIPAPADFNGDGDVGPADLAQLLSQWGSCEGCPEDLDGDGMVGPADLEMVLAGWT